MSPPLAYARGRGTDPAWLDLDLMHTKRWHLQKNSDRTRPHYHCSGSIYGTGMDQ